MIDKIESFAAVTVNWIDNNINQLPNLYSTIIRVWLSIKLLLFANSYCCTFSKCVASESSANETASVPNSRFCICSTSL